MARCSFVALDLDSGRASKPNLAVLNLDEVQWHAARALRVADAARRRPLTLPLIHLPVPVGTCWTEKPLAGRARDRADSAAAQDVPSAEPGQCLRSRAAPPHDRQVIGSHLLVTFLCEQKSYWVGGSRTIRLTSLVMATPWPSRRPNKKGCQRGQRPSRRLAIPAAEGEKESGGAGELMLAPSLVDNDRDSVR